jgi:hypothetical protein
MRYQAALRSDESKIISCQTYGRQSPNEKNLKSLLARRAFST